MSGKNRISNLSAGPNNQVYHDDLIKVVSERFTKLIVQEKFDEAERCSDVITKYVDSKLNAEELMEEMATFDPFIESPTAN